MPDETYLNVPGAKRAASNLQEAVAQFGGAIEGLKGRLARDEGCWSDDDIGKTFANKYVAPKDQTLSELGDTHKSLHSMAHDLPAVIFKVVQDQDQAYGDLMNKIDDNVITYSQTLATPGVGTSSAGVVKRSVTSSGTSAPGAAEGVAAPTSGGQTVSRSALVEGTPGDTSQAEAQSRITGAMLGALGGGGSTDPNAPAVDPTQALVDKATALTQSGDAPSQAAMEEMVRGAVGGTVGGILS